MNKLFYISIFFSIGILPHALSQNKIGDLSGIYYQAVAVDETGKEIVGTDISGKPVYKKAIGVRFTITKGLNGPVQWEETHTTTTDKYGMFTLIIGKGTVSGSNPYPRMLDIPWIDADQFLKVELAIKNDGNYRLVSNQQFMSVPYSFYTDDIADNAITTYKILDSAILNQDIHTAAVDSRTVLDSTLLNQDINTGAVDSRTVLDSTLINQDIKTGAVDSRTVLDSTLINQDINTGAIDSRTILDSTILNQDLGTGSIDSRAILDGTLNNADIADSTIDLATKVTGLLPVSRGGTGTDTLTANSLIIGNDRGALRSLGKATDGQIPVGVTDSLPKLKVLAGTDGIKVSVTPDSVIISSGIANIISTVADTIDPGIIFINTTWLSPPIAVPGVDLGNIVVGSIPADLKGCQMTTFVSEPGMIKVSIYNGTFNNVNLGTNRILKVMVVQ